MYNWLSAEQPSQRAQVISVGGAAFAEGSRKWRKIGAAFEEGSSKRREKEEEQPLKRAQAGGVERNSL
jgi:hypothetical protein